MTRPYRRFQASLESLEGKALLSAVPILTQNTFHHVVTQIYALKPPVLSPSRRGRDGFSDGYERKAIRGSLLAVCAGHAIYKLLRCPGSIHRIVYVMQIGRFSSRAKHVLRLLA